MAMVRCSAPGAMMAPQAIAVVTGAAGSIGRHLCADLSRQGYQVLGLGRGSWGPAGPGKWGVSRWLRADVSAASLASLLGNDRAACYVHCAGSGAVSASFAEPLADFEKTTSSTLILLDHVRKTNPEARTVLASSAAVYGEQGEHDLVESAPRAPVSPYGVHKHAAELLCESYARFLGLSVSIVRLFSVYGEEVGKQLLWDALQEVSRRPHLLLRYWG